MRELPRGWAWARLDDVAEWGSGGTPSRSKPAYYNGGIPWAVIGDMNDEELSITNETISQSGLDGSSAKMVGPESVLIAMYGSIGKLALPSLPVCTNQAIAFAIPAKRALERMYLFWYLLSQRQPLIAAGRGGTQQNISQKLLKSWPIPVAPIEEQRAICVAVSEHFDSLQRGTDLIKTSAFRSQGVGHRLLGTLVGPPWPTHWKVSTVAHAGRVDLGRQRHPNWHSGDYPRPYLRVANVFEDRLDLSDVMEMDFPPEVFERFKLVAGDILLNEGQSPHLLGRPAMYRGQPEEIAFTNSLLRFRASPEVLPEWALLVFRHYMHSGRFTQEVRITTNIAHLSAARFKSIEFPIPPLAEQQCLIETAHRDMSHQAELERILDAAGLRAARLRQAVLEAAFRGELVSQDPNDEAAEVLLNRIRAEREAAAANKTRRPRSRKAISP